MIVDGKTGKAQDSGKKAFAIGHLLFAIFYCPVDGSLIADSK